MELSDDEIDTIYKVNTELSKLVDKFGKDKLMFSAQWLFKKPVANEYLILKDEKGWEHKIDWVIGRPPIRTYRIRKFPPFNPISIDSDPDPLPMMVPDYIFNLRTTKIHKRDCGCVDLYHHYEIDV